MVQLEPEERRQPENKDITAVLHDVTVAIAGIALTGTIDFLHLIVGVTHQGLRKLPRLRLGRHALYYRDLGKDYFVPYHHIDRAFIRISECQPDDSPAYYYYRIILVHKGKEFANLIINEEEVADRVLERLKEIRPEIQIGLDPNTDYSKPRFS